MTTDPRGRRRSRRPRPHGVVLSAIALFLTIFTLLAWQMRSGHDPALGAGTAAAAAKQRPVVKRVVRRVVVVPAQTQVPQTQSDGDAAAQQAAAEQAAAEQAAAEQAAAEQAAAEQAAAAQQQAPLTTRAS